ncbi:cysteine desulfurase family protein [Allorhizocola rhizosphaerae]|uniref:cysteine desulfurase family protein n=1 Tax=Allorhizocola rhizosphaerae TaxID=1872709 RepID=UPI000E3DE8CB|nr:aminotransferase class V-fold PLP-dependent enzyme [Allorhizocola rhizosphaerae]
MQVAYFDSATSTPLHPAARDALLASIEDGWADPNRLYAQARRARQLLDAARGAIADVLGARAEELTFTPSGSWAVQTAVLGALAARRRAGQTLVHSAIEHSALLHAAQRHVHSGGSAVEVGVDRAGHIDRTAWQEAVSGPGVAVAALISASHEVGTVQPVEWAAGFGVPLLVDAAMTVGRLAVPDGWSYLSASARKWGGPAGVGVMVIRKGARWQSPWPSAETAPNLPAILAAAAALQAVQAEAEAESARQSALIDRIRRTVAATVPDVEIVGDPVDRLPHLVTFSCLYVDGEALLHALDRRGFAVSSGSSCTSSTLQPSHVLAAMGALTHGNIRLSLHRDTTDADVDRFLAELPGIVADIRAEVGVA